MKGASEPWLSALCVFFLCMKNQVKAPKPVRPMIPQPIPMPTFAPSLKPPLFGTVPDVCDFEDEDDGVVKVAKDECVVEADKGEDVVKVVEDVELGGAAMVEGAEPTTKVATSAAGAGAAKVSAVGMSQCIEPSV
jgi:hypothetical protein